MMTIRGVGLGGATANDFDSRPFGMTATLPAPIHSSRSRLAAARELATIVVAHAYAARCSRIFAPDLSGLISLRAPMRTGTRATAAAGRAIRVESISVV